MKLGTSRVTMSRMPLAESRLRAVVVIFTTSCVSGLITWYETLAPARIQDVREHQHERDQDQKNDDRMRDLVADRFDDVEHPLRERLRGGFRLIHSESFEKSCDARKLRPRSR